MAKTKTKAKTVKTARSGLVFDDKGFWMVGGEQMGGEHLSDTTLIDLARKSWPTQDMPHECIVEIELELPKARVVKTTYRAVKQ